MHTNIRTYMHPCTIQYNTHNYTQTFTSGLKAGRITISSRALLGRSNPTIYKLYKTDNVSKCMACTHTHTHTHTHARTHTHTQSRAYSKHSYCQQQACLHIAQILKPCAGKSSCDRTRSHGERPKHTQLHIPTSSHCNAGPLHNHMSKISGSHELLTCQ